MAKVDIKQFKTSNGGTKTVYSRQFLDQQQNMQQPTTQVVRSTMIQRATGQQMEIPTQANSEVSVQQAAKNVDMAQAISIDLPSRFVFYSFKDLYIKPMRNIHRAKLAAAYQMQAVRPVVEVIDSLLSTSDGQTGLAYQLTEPDFNYLMYWIRIHFFTTVPFTIKAKCTNPEHIKQVEEVGCCTDICDFNGSMGLANYYDQWNRDVDIIVHEDAIATFNEENRGEYVDAAKLLMKLQGIQLVKK